MNHICIAKLNVRHLGCRHGFLSMQYSKLPIKMLAICIFRVIHQIFDSPTTPRIQYTKSVSFLLNSLWIICSIYDKIFVTRS